MRKILSIVFATFALSTSFAQQDPQFSQFMHNRLFVNPAYAGSNDAFCFNLLYRDQWDRFGGGPKSAVLGVDGPVELLHGGLGISFLSDKPGLQKNTNFKLAYAYRFDLGSGKLAFGIDGGLLQRGYNEDEIVAKDKNDPFLPKGSDSKFDLGAGVYFNSEKVYLGISSSHLMEGEFEYDKVKSENVRHYYFMGGYNWELNPTFTLKPSVFVKSDAVETQLDVNLNLHIKDRFWIGGSYRLEDAVVAMAGVNITEDFRVGYAFDFTTSKIKDYSQGTHEIFIGYCFKIKKKALPMLRNVRFL
jgi:type IX secretion system PorP/SprF family membrane protein